jgi:hypothetical protein
MTSPQSAALRPSQPHIHIKGLQCPVCDQLIPNEKADQVRVRMEERERAVSEAVAARMKEQFAAERVQIESNARTVLEQATRENAAAIEAVKAEAAQKEAVAREEGSLAGHAAAQQQIVALTQANADMQAAAQQKIEALTQANTDLQAATREQLDALTRANADVRAAAQQQVAQAECGKAEMEAAARERIAAAETAKAGAEIEATAVKENHEALMNERLQEQREALEKANTVALNARDAKYFEEKPEAQGQAR